MAKSPNEQKSIRKFTNGFFGKDTEKSANVLHTVRLYNYFLKHLNSPPAELARSLKGIVNITPQNVSEIQNIIRGQHMSVQQGGSDTVDQNKDKDIDQNKDQNKDKDKDKTQEFYDKLFNRVGNLFPPSWDRVFYYMFILHGLENTKFIGPIATTAFDTVSLSLPTIGQGVGAVLDVGSTVILSPIPGAAIAAPFIGYIPKLLMGLAAINLNFGRRRFGQAFKVLLDLVPLLGETLSQTAINFEVFMKNYEASRERLLRDAASLSPSAAESLACILPIFSNPTPRCTKPFESEEIKIEMESRVFKEMPFLAKMGIVRFEQLTPSGIWEALRHKIKVPTLQNTIGTRRSMIPAMRRRRTHKARRIR